MTGPTLEETISPPEEVVKKAEIPEGLRRIVEEFKYVYKELKEIDKKISEDCAVNLVAIYEKNKRTSEMDKVRTERSSEASTEEEPATDKQKALLTDLVRQGKVEKIDREKWNSLTRKEASEIISSALKR